VSEEGQTAKVAGDVISFGTGGATILPPAGETQIVGAFPADVDVAEVVVQGLRVREGLGALQPETDVLGRGGDGGSHIVGQGSHSRAAVKYSRQETIESQDQSQDNLATLGRLYLLLISNYVLSFTRSTLTHSR
jgi:hypothetical protein